MARLRENAFTYLGSAIGVDVTGTGASTVFTVPSVDGAVQNMYPALVLVRCGTLTTPGTQYACASFGFNSPDYDDWLGDRRYDFTAAGQYIETAQPRATLYFSYAPNYGPEGSAFVINVGTASDAAAESWDVHLFGCMLPE